MPTLRANLISHSQLTDGNASVLFDGTTDSITIPSTSAFAFGTGDWTVEMFVNFTSLSGQQTLVGDTYGSTAGWYLYKQSNNRLGVYYSSIVVDGTATIEADRWYHLAFVRNNGITSIFIDGVMDATGADTTDATITQYYIGDTADQTSGELFGYMSNLRITRTAVYKNNFTVPTFKLKEIPGTILLALQSSSSTTEAAVVIGGSLSANGDPTATAFGPGLKEDIKEEGVVFDGVTNFDTQDYLIPPRGKTTERNRGRGIIAAGGAVSPYKDIQVVDIASSGIAQDFGDLLNTAQLSGSASSSTRMLVAAGYIAPTQSNVIEFITIANIASSTDFGDLTQARRRPQGLSNSTRGVFVGGNAPPTAGVNTIDFVTIATAGNASDFGDTNNSLASNGGAIASSTRGVYTIGGTPAYTNIVEFITIATTGNGQDFGDLTVDANRGYVFRGSTCDSTRGLFAGGFVGANVLSNTMEFVTIATTGNGTDFGDLTVARRGGMGTSNSRRSIFAGGYTPGAFRDEIDQVTIQTTGNATNFGDLIKKIQESSGSSDSHGGL